MFNLPLNRFTKQYQVYSVARNGVEFTEGVFNSIEDAEQYATQIANTYGPADLQDCICAHEITHISYRPIWILNKA